MMRVAWLVRNQVSEVRHSRQSFGRTAVGGGSVGRMVSCGTPPRGSQPKVVREDDDVPSKPGNYMTATVSFAFAMPRERTTRSGADGKPRTLQGLRKALQTLRQGQVGRRRRGHGDG